MINTEIQHYRIIEKIGEGGMATVYKAVHITIPNMYRAIKVLNPALAHDPAIRTKFVTEARTLASLDHPNIVKIFDYIEDKGQLMLVMEYVAGDPLDKLIQFKTGPINEERAVNMFLQIIDAIGYAHSHALIHRDIKPSNILIANDGTVKVIDFGIVKILEDDNSPGATKTGTRIGTPLYMSPEQILARGVDERADIYALGVTLFQMVTGKAPYDHTLSEFEIQTKIVNDPLPRAKSLYPAVSEHIQHVIDKATAKKKEARYQNCQELKQELSNKDKVISPDAVKALLNRLPPPKSQQKSMFANPFSFQGRIRRTELGLTYIIFLTYLIILAPIASDPVASIFGLAFIPLIWFVWAQGAKRAHDLGHSGWMILIPIYNPFLLMFKEGQPSINEYGANPKNN